MFTAFLGVLYGRICTEREKARREKAQREKNNICLQCMKRPKHKDFTFCSKDCSKAAALAAPKLIKIPSNHVMYQNVKRDFESSWRGQNKPSVLDIYLITWSASSQSSFDKYRVSVQGRTNLRNGNEAKRFRAEQRACCLGEPGHLSLCNLHCNLCAAIRTGFKSSFEQKQKLSQGVTYCIRLGRGVYSTPTSSKAFAYARNIHKQSTVKTVIYSRVVLGKTFVTAKEDPELCKAPPGFDSVEARPGPGSEFIDIECVVYDKDAIRPAYLIMLA